MLTFLNWNNISQYKCKYNPFNVFKLSYYVYVYYALFLYIFAKQHCAKIAFPQVIVFMTYLIFVLFNDSSGIYLWKAWVLKNSSHNTELNRRLFLGKMWNFVVMLINKLWVCIFIRIPEIKLSKVSRRDLQSAEYL